MHEWPRFSYESGHSAFKTKFETAVKKANCLNGIEYQKYWLSAK